MNLHCRLDVVVVTAGGSGSDVRGNVGSAIGISVGVRGIVDGHLNASGDIDGVRVVDDVGLDDGVDGGDGGHDGVDGLDDGNDGLDGRGDVGVDLDTLGVDGQLVEVTARLGGNALERVGLGGSVLYCRLA